MSAGVRIGELSRRVGVSRELLRAWERRYAVLSPARSRGGLRLYSEADERRVRAMLGHLAGGYAAAEAARLARDAEPPVAASPSSSDGLEDVARPLREALERLDEGGTSAIERALGAFGRKGGALGALGLAGALRLEASAGTDSPGLHDALRDAGVEGVLREVIVPYLHEREARSPSSEGTTAGAFCFGLALGWLLRSRSRSRTRRARATKTST